MYLLGKGYTLQAFIPTLNQMLILFICIMIGWAVNKLKLLPDNADQTISKLLSFVVMPALIINSFYNNCTIENLTANAPLIVYSSIYYGLSTLIGIILGPRFSKDKGVQGLYKYSFMITNMGFMGNALILGLFGQEKLFSYLIFSLPGTILVYSIGVVWLTGGKKKFSWRSFLNPMFGFMILGILLGITHPPLPVFVTSTLSSIASCFSALAMLLTGFVIGKFDIIKLLKVKPVYILTLLRTILIPIGVYFLFKAVGTPDDILLYIVFTAAMPLGMNTIVFPAAYGGDLTTGASMAVISNIVGLISVPLILSLVL